MNTLLKRALTGAVFVAVMIGGLYISPYTLFTLFFIINVLSLIEFQTLVNTFEVNNRVDNPVFEKVAIVVIGSAVYLLTANWGLHFFDTRYTVLILPLLFLLFLKELYGQAPVPFLRLSFYLTGIVYLSLPLGLANLLGNWNNTFSPNIVLAVLLMNWINDSLAYLSGRFLGRTPLFKRISPKKTWEGSLGGAVFTLLASYFIAQYVGVFSLGIWLAAAVLVIFFGTWGDLVESMLKRNVGVKDSGNLLPGHGGILDRFDAFYFLTPFVVALFYLFA